MRLGCCADETLESIETCSSLIILWRASNDPVDIRGTFSRIEITPIEIRPSTIQLPMNLHHVTNYESRPRVIMKIEMEIERSDFRCFDVPVVYQFRKMGKKSNGI